MKHKHTKNILAVIGLLASLSAFGGIKEGGGFARSATIYECAEKNPSDAANPVQAILTEEFDGTHLLRLGQKLNDPWEVQMIYTNSVVLNKAIRCILPCELYENQNDQVSFGLTLLPQEIQAQFSSPTVHVDLVCVKPTK